MTRYWFTADNHFGHENILKLCNRPFKSLKDMDNILINNWNSKIKIDDMVFHLGDFAFKNADMYLSRLNGHIIPIAGNHDKKGIIQSLEIAYGGRDFLLMHRPDLAFSNEPAVVLCGHVHTLWKTRIVEDDEFSKFYINVGVDVWNFKPVSFRQILKLIKKEFV